MNQKPYHIVFTTIYYPEPILQALLKNISRYNHLSEVKVWVIGDRKTPAKVVELCQNISQQGLEVEYMDIPTQDAWGRDLKFYRQIPYDNDTRRNVGYLRALQESCEILISIDDDNFPIDEDDFVGFYAKTGEACNGELVSEGNKFHNVCEYLEFTPKRLIYPRGFPFNLRGVHHNQPNLVSAPEESRIGVTAGLWINEPDVDATTWLNGKIVGQKYLGANRIVLSQDTWSPVNTQNTSLVRQLIPAFLNIPMGWPVPGGKIDRYGDIWGGYFLLALMQRTEYYIAFGRPIVSHNRNPHNYINDLRYEFWGIILTDWLLEWLRSSFQPSGSDITKRVEQLSEAILNDALGKMPAWCPQEMRDFMKSTAEYLSLWAQTCREVGV